MDQLEELFSGLSNLINIAAGLTIVWGTANAFAKMLLFEVAKVMNNTSIKEKLHGVRDMFGHRIALGLEFFLAADLLRLIFHQSINDLIEIGALVAIRIAITFFLEREID